MRGNAGDAVGSHIVVGGEERQKILFHGIGVARNERQEERLQGHIRNLVLHRIEVVVVVVQHLGTHSSVQTG